MYSSEIYVIYFGQKQLSSKKRNNTQLSGKPWNYFEKVPLFTLNADINLKFTRTSAITDMVLISSTHREEAHNKN